MEPKLCGNRCGFFGSASTLGLCSKCFRQHQANAASVAVAPPAVDPPAPEEVKLQQDRCRTCKKRVRVARGYKCRCGFLFCESHRYPEEHMCTFDYRAMGKHEIAKINPMVKADKIQRI